MSEYLFEYLFAGAEWALVVEAESIDEAVERVRAMAGAQLQGVVSDRIPQRTAFRPHVVLSAPSPSSDQR